VQTIGATFQPALIEIPAGTTVLWSDLDGTQHIVASGVGSSAPGAGNLFDLSLTDHNTVLFTFETPGVFPYFCRIHEAMNMRGTVTVIPSDGGAANPP
jgi:plastocyanin